ncbi:MAG: hypothetical protein LBD75_01735 [Candidatus Peribacteria bacterium]|nr:hypothetical protein [Candidatus Peribacteria bacterium]
MLSAQDDMNFHILPELKQDEISTGQAAIEEIRKTAGSVMDTYRKQAEKLDLKQQMATGIMNWNTILQYLIYLTRFLSQIGLFIGALMIIFAGYKYATNVF